MVNGTLLPFFLYAFVCRRNHEPLIFNVLVIIVILNATISLFTPVNILLNLTHAILCNAIGLFASLKNIRNRADYGLASCFATITVVLCFVLFESPLNISPIDFYEKGYQLLQVFLPAFITGSTVVIFLSYYIELNGELKQLAQIDTLTGLSNRRFAFQEIQKQKSFLLRKNYRQVS